MLDIYLFRNEAERKKIIESEKKRYKDPEVVEKICQLDKERIRINFELDIINKKLNSVQSKIKSSYKQAKSGELAEKELLESLKKLKLENEAIREEKKMRALELKKEIDKLIAGVGNILDDDVPKHQNDDGNIILRSHTGIKGLENKPFGYSELMKNYTNSDAGAEVIGHRGYYLNGKMALLYLALKNYAIDFLVSKGYEYIQPPVMMRKKIMSKTSQLSDFDDQLYKIDGDLYLIATSEQPLTALFMNKKLSDCELPKLLAGDSLCFRKEAGAYGKDNAGIFRVHQFEKIEQFVICKPEESKGYHEKMIRLSEEFYQSLGLSYRIVLISSGEMNDSAAKKYDLEAFFPNSQKFRELVSASNCTDYQSRSLNVGHGYPKANEKQTYVHMLNSTLCAIQRSLCCIVENYQDDNKIIVPDVLRPYTKFDEINL